MRGDDWTAELLERLPAFCYVRCTSRRVIPACKTQEFWNKGNGAAIGMRVEDVYTQNRRLWVRLHEKGGKQHVMPCHHNLKSYLHAYIDGGGLASDPKALLFQTYSHATGRLTGNPLPRQTPMR